MLKAVLRQGAIVPLEPLPSDWTEGAYLYSTWRLIRHDGKRHPQKPQAMDGPETTEIVREVVEVDCVCLAVRSILTG